MRIVFYTRTGFESDPLFLYIYSHVAARHPDHAIVAYQAPPRTLSAKLKKIQRLGFLNALEILSSAPIASLIRRKETPRLRKLLSDLPKPNLKPSKAPQKIVHTINGPDAIEAIKSFAPDILLQTGAGVLKKQIFTLAKIATLNMHHGIAPLIKGMSSIYWGLYERRPDWIGATIHEIDEGIDTGAPLGYARVTAQNSDRFPELFARATQQGVATMLQVLERLELGDRRAEQIPPGPHEYRSTISGWKMLAVQLHK